jgi:ATP-dependent Clp protease ATP-binding subunit ClpB
MSSNNFTEATTKALQESLALAVENSHSQLSPFHLASVLLTATPDNTAPLFLSILNKAVADTEIVRRGCARAVVKLPSVNPPPDADSISFSPALGKVIRRASEIMKEKVSVWHLVQSFKKTQLNLISTTE